MNDFDVHIKLVTKCRDIAVNSLKHFLDLLGIDNNLLNDIYDLDIIIDIDDEVTSRNCAILEDNIIWIGKEYLDLMIDYLTKVSNPNSIIEEISGTIVHEMLHANRHKILLKNPNLIDEFDYALSLEESIVEVISNIIISFRNSDDLDLEYKKITMLNSNVPYDEKMGMILIDTLGLFGLKWFITSPYTKEYYNYFALKYGNNYESLVKVFDELYNDTIESRTSDKETVNRAYYLIKK